MSEQSVSSQPSNDLNSSSTEASRALELEAQLPLTG